LKLACSVLFQVLKAALIALLKIVVFEEEMAISLGRSEHWRTGALVVVVVGFVVV
jgi:hypothetical protein